MKVVTEPIPSVHVLSLPAIAFPAAVSATSRCSLSSVGASWACTFRKPGALDAHRLRKSNGTCQVQIVRTAATRSIGGATMTAADPGAEPLRDVLGEATGLRVQLVTVEPGQHVDWHAHTTVSDTIVAVTGIVVVETLEPPSRHRLESGDRVTVPAGTAHTVGGENGAACRFLNVHAGGIYDFRPRHREQ